MSNQADPQEQFNSNECEGGSMSDIFRSVDAVHQNTMIGRVVTSISLVFVGSLGSDDEEEENDNGDTFHDRAADAETAFSSLEEEEDFRGPLRMSMLRGHGAGVKGSLESLDFDDDDDDDEGIFDSLRLLHGSEFRKQCASQGDSDLPETECVGPLRWSRTQSRSSRQGSMENIEEVGGIFDSLKLSYARESSFRKGWEHGSTASVSGSETGSMSE